MIPKSVKLQFTAQEWDYYGNIGYNIRKKHSANRAANGKGSVDPFLGRNDEKVELVKSANAYRSEYGVAKYLLLDYIPKMGARADIAGCIEVKWKSKKNGDLFIPVKNWHSNYAYVSVRNSDKECELEAVGWIDGWKAVNYPIKDPGENGKPGGKPAYTIPQSMLQEMNELFQLCTPVEQQRCLNQ